MVPVFNGAATIRACLDSILRQQLDCPFEVLVADNDSTDATAAILREFSQVKSVRVTPRCRGRARNHGAALAQYDALAFIDSDVVLGPHWSATLLKALVSPFACLQTPIEVKLTHWSTRSVTPVLGQYFLSANLPKLTIDSAAMMIDRRVFQEVGGFNEALERWEDTELTLKVVNQGHGVAVIEGARASKVEDRNLWQRMKRAYHIGQIEFTHLPSWIEMPALSRKSVWRTLFFSSGLLVKCQLLGALSSPTPQKPQHSPSPGWRRWDSQHLVSKSVVAVATPEFLSLRTVNCASNLLLRVGDPEFTLSYSKVCEGAPFLRGVLTTFNAHESVIADLSVIQQRIMEG